MKFQLKALAVALALSATVPAQAAISLGSSGDGSFVLSTLNNANGISATFDLGFTYSQFGALVASADSNGGSYSWDLTTGNYADAWNTFSSIAVSGTSNWAIFSSDNEGAQRGAAAVGARGYYVTATDLNNAVTQTSTAVNSLINFDKYLLAANGTGNHQSVANGASTAPLIDVAGAGSANAYGTGAAGDAGVRAINPFDTTVNFLQTVTNGGSTPNTIGFTGNANGLYTFKLSSNGLLTFTTSVSAVPEADSYAMLLAGLGLVGLVARRRKA
ncbi:PEP-CTERM sorting domain-containing protein [Methylophilus sp.]|uniref:PEP-CTERM sorting domain-containing protein n=1 Tax=Methylophilus sp. TaxID=29541 RepID=UPI004035797C